MPSTRDWALVLWLCVFAGSDCLGQGPLTTSDLADGFRLATDRLEIEVRQGVIVSARNLITGEVHASGEINEQQDIPAGMGRLGENPKTAALQHSPWGKRPMASPGNRRTDHPTLHRPYAGSKFQRTRTEHGVEGTWTGLSNGVEQFPDETLTLKLDVDPADGAVRVQSHVASSGGGVYGVQFPIANLHAEHRIYVPSFGGLMYDNDAAPSIVSLGASPFWEAPVIAVEGRKGSLGLWIENETERPTFCFLTWTGKSFAVAIESLALMPFEPHREFTSSVWKIDAFDGGWVAAMTPYKSWYARTYARELQQRAAVAWADQIHVVLDVVQHQPEVWRKIAELLDPKTVMIHDWNGRAPGFDQELPDWTPRAGYVERVKALQALGFRTQAYVNSYCVNYNSPVFIRDGIRDFGLTRRISSFLKYADPPEVFDTAKDGEILYLDPLSARWRTYHTDMMIRWFQETGTDANYEDTGGTTGDFGNGVVDGLSAAQGGVALFRELLDRNGQVPMSAEYAPAAIAFAVRWPLRYQQAWGTIDNRAWWMERQRPVSAYLFGPEHRPWLPSSRADDTFHRHLVLDCSDALGGVSQFNATSSELQATSGSAAQMKYRAQFFSRRGLVPDFSSALQPAHLACQYRDRDGRRYDYFADESVHQLVEENGSPVYARITGRNHFESPLTVPGWPVRRGETLSGLNPAARYALLPDDRPAPAITVDRVPEGVAVTRFYETPEASVLCLTNVDEKAPRQTTLSLELDPAFQAVLVNDRPRRLTSSRQRKRPDGQLSFPFKLQVKLPAQLVFLKSDAGTVPPETFMELGDRQARFVVRETGLDRGGVYPPPHRMSETVPGEATPVPFFFMNDGGDAEIVMDWLLHVPDRQSALKVYVQNRQNVYGDGAIARLSVNGRVIHEADLGPQPNADWKPGMPANQKTTWSKDLLAWTIPLGDLAGRPVLVTLATDPKQGNNSDSLWWSSPKLVLDRTQRERFEKIR